MNETERTERLRRAEEVEEEHRRLRDREARISNGLEMPGSGLLHARGCMQAVFRWLDGVAQSGATLEEAEDRAALAALLLDALGVATTLASREGRRMDGGLWRGVRGRLSELQAAVEAATAARDGEASE